MVVTTHTDLSRFRTERRAGPPFYNMFRSVYVGSFCPVTVDEFLREKSEITDFDFSSVRDVIDELAGRYPYYLQVAAALFYLFAGGESRVTPEQIDRVRSEFRMRTAALFDDAWRKLPEAERSALTLLAIQARPETGQEEFETAVQSLERRGYVLEGRIFSSALAEHIRQRARWVAVNTEAGTARIGLRSLPLPAAELQLLKLLAENPSRVITYREIGQALGADPDGHGQTLPPADIDALVADLARRLADVDAGREYVEHIAGIGYRFTNPPITG